MQEEVFASRDRAYSAWHRRNSTRWFVGIDRAQLLAMVDLDCSLFIEYDDGTKEPLALIETARDVGQPYKPATVTLALARKAKLPCYCGAVPAGAGAEPCRSSVAGDRAHFRLEARHGQRVARAQRQPLG